MKEGSNDRVKFKGEFLPARAPGFQGSVTRPGPAGRKPTRAGPSYYVIAPYAPVDPWARKRSKDPLTYYTFLRFVRKLKEKKGSTATDCY